MIPAASGSSCRWWPDLAAYGEAARIRRMPWRRPTATPISPSSAPPGRSRTRSRSGGTAGGRAESTAEHSWRLYLMAVALADALPEVDLRRLLELLIVHDLGEAVSGDVPAPLQRGSKAAGGAGRPRYAARASAGAGRRAAARALGRVRQGGDPRGAVAKGLDRLETVLTHVEGAHGPGFDYAFNLGYGRGYTDAHPLVAALRAPVDAETARLAGQAPPAQPRRQRLSAGSSPARARAG